MDRSWVGGMHLRHTHILNFFNYTITSTKIKKRANWLFFTSDVVKHFKSQGQLKILLKSLLNQSLS